MGGFVDGWINGVLDGWIIGLVDRWSTDWWIAEIKFIAPKIQQSNNPTIQ